MAIMMKNVLITGGDKGIGRAIAERMATLYDKVVFSYNTNVDGANEMVAKFPNCTALQCDLGNQDSIANFIEQAKLHLGRIDILVNNAGYDNDAIFAKMEQNQWDSVLDVNLRAMFPITKSVIDDMMGSGWGRIVNLTSIAGYTGAFGKANYAAAKAGVVGLTKSLALELGSKGITVNAIAPGAVETDMLMRIPEKYRDVIIGNIPCKRLGRVEEVADLVEFLTSDKATYINGQTIHINGGSYCL